MHNKSVRDLGSVRGKAPHQQARLSISLSLTTNIMQPREKDTDKGKNKLANI